jgi:SAM-dependent methyltransferase
MKNKESWKPSKYVWKKGKLIASRDKRQVNVGSRLVSDIIAGYYELCIPKYARGKLLDLGCGHAPLFHAYNKYADDIVCVDWENTAHKNMHLDFTCDLNDALPFGDNEFDTIIFSDVFEHIQSPQLLWREIMRILANDGILLMNVPFFYPQHEIPHDYYRYTEFALKRFVEEGGGELIFFESTGGLLEILGDIYAKILSSLGFIGRWAADLLQSGIKIVRKTKLGIRIYNKTEKYFPLGHFLVVRKKG